jgi:SIR2-like protein
MIDPVISLAFSVNSKKGIYALLLGSGVSRAAGILTGREIVLDLIRKLATTANEDCEPDPVEWYISKYSEEPDYSKILEITKSATIRNQRLRSYFEPDDEEREQGLKMPTQAHKSIANLVKSGFIKVILTTNFDRLIEVALEEVGITPTTISTPNAIKGALPLTHTECTVIKLHGDYLDTRIKNSSKELEKYSQPLNKLLDRIFDEYGLVVCGWSAELDTALREALQRCKSHRFQTFWTIRGEQKDKTKKLIQLRRAEEIIIKDADTFFKELEEKVLALQELDKPHPLSTKVAITVLKKYLRDDSQDIRLQEMVMMEETEKLYQKLSSENFPVKTYPNPSADEFLKRIQLYDSYTETLLAIMINGCYWGRESHEHLWIKCLQRIASPSGEREKYEIWNKLRLYPALLLLYGGGISSIVAGKYSTFSGLLYKPKLRLVNQEYPALFRLIPEIGEDSLSKIGIKNFLFLNESIFKAIREPIRAFLPSDIDCQRFFDRFEYLHALVYADFWQKQRNDIWGPVGIFAFREYYGDVTENFMPAEISKEIKQEQLDADDDWPPLKAGLFDGSAERFQFIKSEFDSWVRKAYGVRYHIHF